MNISVQGRVILGILHDEGASLLPSRLRAVYGDRFHEPVHGPCPAEFVRPLSEVLNIEEGMGELLSLGLVEFTRDQALQKRVRLSDEGRRLFE